MKLLVTGATGFVGRALVAEACRRGHDVSLLSRDAMRARQMFPELEANTWDPMKGLPPAESLAVDAIVHLAGENLGDHRWTRKRMAAIRDSRVVGTRNLIAAASRGRPRALVCASAIGWYGDRGDEVLTEEKPSGSDFLASVCVDWEAEAAKAKAKGIRWVSIRTGVVLGASGGALSRLLGPFKMNLGGPIGGGKQWMSWIHLSDIVGVFLHAAERDAIEGPVNGTAPFPQTNSAFTKALAGALGKWSFLPMPGFALRIIVGKFAEALLASQRCDPAVAKKTGYGFKFPTLEGALRDILKP